MDFEVQRRPHDLGMRDVLEEYGANRRPIDLARLARLDNRLARAAGEVQSLRGALGASGLQAAALRLRSPRSMGEGDPDAAVLPTCSSPSRGSTQVPRWQRSAPETPPPEEIPWWLRSAPATPPPAEVIRPSLRYRSHAQGSSMPLGHIRSSSEACTKTEHSKSHDWQL
eukprot:CAMPEP_0197880438 /NCGR_PEP_ID=MMETSP1439-20131203/8250_1 /TAXON_ID=66791 /ORGANISM="Gonyaulax spinifera, Strain CCMP409" /LENGTH=168 /DNA_ID=CAMNT_0043499991 /DNA_START=89 /DNA_END=592 /DNA_ORIENTATION=-